jgi:hypothetical protein
MTAQLARIAVAFPDARTQTTGRSREWGRLRSQATDLASAHTSGLADTEWKWPLAWRALLVAGTSAGLWMLILVPLSIAGILQLLP